MVTHGLGEDALGCPVLVQQMLQAASWGLSNK